MLKRGSITRKTSYLVVLGSNFFLFLNKETRGNKRAIFSVWLNCISFTTPKGIIFVVIVKMS